MALAYEALFRVPVATLFTGIYTTVAHVVEGNLVALEKDLLSRKSGGHLPLVHTQKLKWLSERTASQ